MPYSGSPSHGRPAGSGESGPGLFVRLPQTACTAVGVSTICTVPGDCSPAAIAISLLMRANRNRPICGGLKITKGLRMRLGGSPNMLEDFPEKPKGMHWRTYERWRRVHDVAEQRSTIGLMGFLDRLGRRSSLAPEGPSS